MNGSSEQIVNAKSTIRHGNDQNRKLLSTYLRVDVDVFVGVDGDEYGACVCLDMSLRKYFNTTKNCIIKLQFSKECDVPMYQNVTK